MACVILINKLLLLQKVQKDSNFQGSIKQQKKNRKMCYVKYLDNLLYEGHSKSSFVFPYFFVERCCNKSESLDSSRFSKLSSGVLHS
jgi:hypothetical protein